MGNKPTTEAEILERIEESETRIRLEMYNPFTANRDIIRLEELIIDACDKMLKELKHRKK